MQIARPAADVDFAREKPEVVRGLWHSHAPVNFAALKLVVERSIGTPLQKRLMWPRMRKAVERHGIESLTPQFRYSYCCARLSLGDFSDYWGWEFRQHGDPESSDWAAQLYWNETWLPKWGGGYVPRLLVLGEQGVGDAIFYASILPEAMIRAGHVVFETEKRLHTLLERSLPGLECDVEHPFEERRPGDAFIPAADLMRMFRRRRADFPCKPYLRPDPRRMAEFDAFKGRTGLAWSGRQGRIEPLAFGIAHPVSLQWNESHECAEQPALDLKDDIEGVVALCALLEKVVAVPSSAHHFAGAAGTKTEIIVAPEGTGEVNQLKFDHSVLMDPIGDGVGRLPWYPDATVYRDLETWRRHAA